MMSTGAPPVELERFDSPNHPLAPWFGLRRELRRAHYRKLPPRRHPRTRAIITMVHNEALYFPIWLRYYSRFFTADDIYVFDHETTDGSTSGGGFQRIPVEHPTVDHRWMVDTITDLQHELVNRYEVTVVTDVDEIIMTRPDHGGLGAYLDRFEEEWVNCLGYELLHMREREPPLDPAQPILAQRGWWFANDGYDKAAIATAPMHWRPGFHGRVDYQFNPDPDLRLVHLHRMDYELCRQRHISRSRRPWAPDDAHEQWAAHNLITEDEAFRHWFYEESSFPGIPVTPEPIPPQWRAEF